MTDKKCLFGLTVGLCLAVALFLVGWTGGANHAARKYRAKYRVDTIRVNPDTVIVTSPVLTREIPCFIPSEVDTAAILAKFYTKRVYADTLQLKEFGTVTLVDTVLMNGIDSRQFTYDLTLPTYRHAADRWSFGVGAFVQKGGSGAYGTVRYRHLQMMGGYDFVGKSALLGAQYVF